MISGYLLFPLILASAAVMRQIRLMLRDRRDERLARLLIEKTGNTSGLTGYNNLAKARANEVRLNPPRRLRALERNPPTEQDGDDAVA